MNKKISEIEKYRRSLIIWSVILFLSLGGPLIFWGKIIEIGQYGSDEQLALLILLVLFSTVALILSSWGISNNARKYIFYSNLDISVEIEKENSFKLGHDVNFKVKLIPKRNFSKVLVKASLEMIEEAIRRTGRGQYTYRKVIYSEKKNFGEYQLISGVEREISGAFTIPQREMWPFLFIDSKMKWFLKIHVAIPGLFPDFKEDFLLWALPIR